ncbi:ABC transporter ATP-binding protein [Edaphobacter aggregans]|uniref:ABC transporter ATP-binding protein n=1 Tax=Edaphobacter aggregans TaxID=570835 RepID=UPI0005520840|nr:ABC transporter ATP-binding protein [Edaphobacter aggregans]
MSDIAIEARDLTKTYTHEEFSVTALDGISLTVPNGDFVALMGPSGSGKSTLLHLVAAMDMPTTGEIRVLGSRLESMKDREVARWRNAHVGFVFQFFNLISVLTALENVELPLNLTSLRQKEKQKHAKTALNLVGLGDRMDHLPHQLSGGQQQRVAVARALVTDPDLILADEPTGNLDASSAQDVLALMQQLHREFDKTIVMVTHDSHAAQFANRTLHLEKGRLLDC